MLELHIKEHPNCLSKSYNYKPRRKSKVVVKKERESPYEIPTVKNSTNTDNQHGQYVAPNAIQAIPQTMYQQTPGQMANGYLANGYTSMIQNQALQQNYANMLVGAAIAYQNGFGMGYVPGNGTSSTLHNYANAGYSNYTGKTLTCLPGFSSIYQQKHFGSETSSNSPSGSTIMSGPNSPADSVGMNSPSPGANNDGEYNIQYQQMYQQQATMSMGNNLYQQGFDE